ncbi:quinon protein alcohol dehydrogenase-like superfamily [Suillus clintonianus]|uniref:quinon protein alcohol dehydrogenase-like superfamily n=1 Tax=Suillus clintonianus TaxID=1904413 RepID=UPI001B86EC8D|nr:quinon protein alcohol dehydrogenase-like superfamily [Suillus clintonianus]KAG2156394.1 quinon protein alcohol dehydrogenase-like superfamily [Suillus clintonianus]
MSPGIFQNSNSTSLVKTSAMTSSSTQHVGAKKNLILKPVMTLEGHERVRVRRQLSFISYFPDGKGMISTSYDKTTRRWDLQAGKEIEEARDVCEQKIWSVAMSRDGQWVVNSSYTRDRNHNFIGELKARDVETRITKTFEGHVGFIISLDVSADNTMLVGGSCDDVWIWSLKTGELMAGPFRSTTTGSRNGAHPWLGVVRFSQDSKKLAVLSSTGRCLEVWDVQTQKLDLKVEESRYGTVTSTPIFWTTKDESIVAAFSFKDKYEEAWELSSVSEVTSLSEAASVSEVASALEPELDRLWPADARKPVDLNTIYEFNALTLKIVGAPFEGHTDTVTGLALSFDCALLASASRDRTFKLWAFKSRQLLASFDDHYTDLLIFSPNSHQLAYTNWGDTKIYIYDPPRICPVQGVQPNTTKHSDLLNSDATRRAVRRNPATFPIPHTLRPPPTIYPEQRPFLRYLRKLLSSRTNAGPPVGNDEPRHPLDFPATSPLPSLPAHATTQTRSHINPRENYRPTLVPPTTLSLAPASQARLHHLFTWWPVRIGHAPPPTVDVPLAWGELRHAAAGAPPKEDDMRRDEDVPSLPTPDPNSQPLTTEQTNTSEHGSGRWCGCF